MVVVSVVLAGLSLLNFLPPWHWLQEINANLGAYYLVAHVFAIGALLWKRTRLSLRARTGRLLLLHAVLGASYAWTMAPFYLASTAPVTGKGFSVLSLNVHSESRNVEALKELLRREKPDIIALFESTLDWHHALLEYGCDGSHFVPQIYEYGISFCSRFPVRGAIESDLGDDVRPGVRASIIHPAGRTISFHAFDALPPLSPEAQKLNKLTVRRVAGSLRHDTGQAIVATDLNATPFSLSYERLRDGANLRDTRRGFGFAPTWDARYPLQWFPIDHVFVKGGLETSQFRRVALSGSDHWGLLVELMFSFENDR